MAKRGIQPSGRLTRAKMLRGAVELFLEKGYQNTTTAEISRAAGMTPSAFFRAFADKEEVLYILVTYTLESQFAEAQQLLGPGGDPLLLYGFETAIQMHIAEMSEPLRDLYVTAYSLPSTSEYIFQKAAEKIRPLFSQYLPQAQERDFYELEIASGSITRGFMARRCDLYFTMERKLSRYLCCCMKLYDVPQHRCDEVIDRVLCTDVRSMAEKVVDDAVLAAETGFEKLIGKLTKQTEKQEDTENILQQ